MDARAEWALDWRLTETTFYSHISSYCWEKVLLGSVTFCISTKKDNRNGFAYLNKNRFSPAFQKVFRCECFLSTLPSPKIPQFCSTLLVQLSLYDFKTSIFKSHKYIPNNYLSITMYSKMTESALKKVCFNRYYSYDFTKTLFPLNKIKILLSNLLLAQTTSIVK